MTQHIHVFAALFALLNLWTAPWPLKAVLATWFLNSWTALALAKLSPKIIGGTSNRCGGGLKSLTQSSKKSLQSCGLIPLKNESWDSQGAEICLAIAHYTHSSEYMRDSFHAFGMVIFLLWTSPNLVFAVLVFWTFSFIAHPPDGEQLHKYKIATISISIQLYYCLYILWARNIEEKIFTTNILLTYKRHQIPWIVRNS